MYLVTAQQMQNIDKTTIESFGIPGAVLMENAGRGAFEMLMKTFPDIPSRRVCVLAGSGNNGGDGFVIARYLLEKGIDTTTFILCEKKRVTGDAALNLGLLEKLIAAGHGNSREICLEITTPEIFHAMKSKMACHDIFIDAILGTGLKSIVRGIYKDVIDMVNSLGTRVFGVDIPSGLNADTGKPMGTCIRASATATFAFAKIGHMLHPGKDMCGKLEIVDIGIPGFIAEDEGIKTRLMDKGMIGPLFRPRNADAHKGTFGHLLVIAGSAGKTGAAALACNSAMACGTGLVTLGVPGSINPAMEPQVTETMTLPLAESLRFPGTLSPSSLGEIIHTAQGKSALAIGPGLGLTPDTIKLVRDLVTHEAIEDIPLIIDADALNALSNAGPGILKGRRGTVIITPHPGEMARLTGRTPGEIQARRMDLARDFAYEFQVTVVLKGAGTIVALPDKKVYICPAGNPGMASGGMGDTLTGMVAGFAAQGFSMEDACVAGVYLHGLAGDMLAKTRGNFGFTASNLIGIIPETIYGCINNLIIQ
ncbi:MAG: NAD(P)H-hydrate dehydratase [Desulfamplus sp.]|nr:NAD(P)H-hydrate dehydratase [Desulfamplus sp.]